MFIRMKSCVHKLYVLGLRSNLLIWIVRWELETKDTWLRYSMVSLLNFCTGGVQRKKQKVQNERMNGRVNNGSVKIFLSSRGWPLVSKLSKKLSGFSIPILNTKCTQNDDLQCCMCVWFPQNPRLCHIQLVRVSTSVEMVERFTLLWFGISIIYLYV